MCIVNKIQQLCLLLMLLGTKNPECTHGYHAPIKKLQNESWIDLHTLKVVTFEDHMWYPGQPNGKNIEECGKYLSDTRGYADATCTYTDCFVCSWKTAPSFRLRGLCKEAKVDRNFILAPELSYDESVVFFGHGKDNIVFSQEFKSWLIIEEQLDNILDSKAKDLKNS